MDMGEEAMVQKKLQKKDTSNLKLRRCFAGRKLRKLPGISKSTGVTQQWICAIQQYVCITKYNKEGITL